MRRGGGMSVKIAIRTFDSNKVIDSSCHDTTEKRIFTIDIRGRVVQ